MKNFIKLSFSLSILAMSSISYGQELKFVMAHKPDNQDNISLIKLFSEKVKQRTNGQIVITPVMPEEMIDIDTLKNYGPHKSTVQKLYVGEVAMAQVSVKTFTNFSNEIDVLDAPLVFRSHEHATRVLDGDLGEGLRKTVALGSNGRLEGLSFTYSGGFRNFYSTKEINKLSDLQGMKIRLLGGRMSRDISDHLGMSMVDIIPHGRKWVDALLNGQLEVDEAELIRLAAYEKSYPDLFKKIKTIIETNHSLYLTMVTVNGRVFKSLTKEQQDIIKEEAQRLAVAERELSIKQEKEAKASFKKSGIKFLKMGKNDNLVLDLAAKKTREMQKNTLGKWYDLIEKELQELILASDQVPIPKISNK